MWIEFCFLRINRIYNYLIEGWEGLFFTSPAIFIRSLNPTEPVKLGLNLLIKSPVL